MTHSPKIQTQSDLADVWRHLMEPLGFRGHSVWMMFVEPDGRPVSQLTEIEDAEAPPDAEQAANLATVLGSLIDMVPGGSVAFLRSRPGRGGVNAQDRAWATVLYAACRDAGVPAEIVHVATDRMLVPLPPDDLPVSLPA